MSPQSTNHEILLVEKFRTIMICHWLNRRNRSRSPHMIVLSLWKPSQKNGWIAWGQCPHWSSSKENVPKCSKWYTTPYNSNQLVQILESIPHKFWTHTVRSENAHSIASPNNEPLSNAGAMCTVSSFYILRLHVSLERISCSRLIFLHGFPRCSSDRPNGPSQGNMRATCKVSTSHCHHGGENHGVSHELATSCQGWSFDPWLSELCHVHSWISFMFKGFPAV